MKVNIFKKLIREVIREELDYKFSRLEKKLNEVLVNGNTNSIVEDRAPQLNSSSIKKTNTQSKVPTPTLPQSNPVLTKDSVLNDILAETAASDDWKKINEEPQVQSVTDTTQHLPEHLTEAFTKDYSQVMEKVEEKARFKNGT